MDKKEGGSDVSVGKLIQFNFDSFLMGEIAIDRVSKYNY